jgi:peptidyl-prolyl cis-trans isomerase B (cyclophilin B)
MPPTQVLMETSHGSVTIELDGDRAPITVANFLSYVDDRFFDGTIFHRVIPNFMIQGGGFTPDMSQKKTKPPIRNESGNGLSNTKGALAMARTSDPDSASSQFFINVVDNPFLDKAQSRDNVGYCVFGQVISGMDVVDKIKAIPTGKRGHHDDVPREDVIIHSIRRV